MRRIQFSVLFCTALLTRTYFCPAQETKLNLTAYRDAAAKSAGDAVQGRQVFESQRAACSKCHAIQESRRLAGPFLGVVGDKYTRDQLVRSVLEPSAGIHPDYATLTIVTTDGRTVQGVEKQRDEEELRLFDAEGKEVALPHTSIESEEQSRTSLMPADIAKQVTPEQFVDLIAYLETLRQDATDSLSVSEMPTVSKPVKLVPFHRDAHKFDHPVWIIAKPGAPEKFLVVEQQTRQIWELTGTGDDQTKKLFADLSHEAITGQFEGVMCLAFHPDFLKNRKYYLNYHVREDGVFSPVVVERQVTHDFSKDVGGASRRLLKIKQPTDLHWGGMLAFGPDGLLYIGAGDGGPQEDPLGNGQNLQSFLGKILRIDVNRTEGDKPYGIPASNPFRDGKRALPEIYAYGLRMPWRFSWDSESNEMWVGDIGQNLFEEVSLVKAGANYGWNVYEGFTPFSDRYRRAGEKFASPVISYRRKDGVSVTGGYVYRGKQNDSYVGAYIFGDFESKRIWALKQKAGKLQKVRQIGSCPEKPASFGIAPDGELFVVGYQGTIYQLKWGESEFE